MERIKSYIIPPLSETHRKMPLPAQSEKHGALTTALLSVGKVFLLAVAFRKLGGFYI